MKYCAKCGSALMDGAAFCTGCGQKVQHLRSTTPAQKAQNTGKPVIKRNPGLGVVLILAAIAIVVSVILMAIAQYNR